MSDVSLGVAYSEFIAHHGVRGMKWGRRRRRHNLSIGSGRSRGFDNEDRVNRLRGHGKDRVNRIRDRAKDIRSRTRSRIDTSRIDGLSLRITLAGMDAVTNILRKVAKVHLTDGYRHSGTMVRGEKAVGKILNNHGDRYAAETILSDTQEFRRISKDKETEIRDGTYVTYRPEDHVVYGADWPGGYTVKIRPKGPVKLPSLKTRFETMAEIVDKRPTDGGKTVRQILSDQEETIKGKLWVKSASAEDLGKYAYGSKVGINWESDEVGKRFITTLREKGYDAMNDDMDSGTDTMATAATVVINKDKFEILETVPRTQADLDENQEKYREYLKRGLIRHVLI